jgi:hypothetical protein
MSTPAAGAGLKEGEFKLKRIVSAGLLALAVAAGPAVAQDASYLTTSAGIFDVNDDKRAAEARMEWRSGTSYWHFKPLVGAMATTDGAFAAFGGVLIDIPLGSSGFILTPSFAPGLYTKGTGKDLGHAVEFRSQIEISYQFANQSRLGIALSHMSNAGLGKSNPGEESLVLTYSVPFSTVFRP